MAALNKDLQKPKQSKEHAVTMVMVNAIEYRTVIKAVIESLTNEEFLLLGAEVQKIVGRR
jgi:hypothetical protein